MEISRKKYPFFAYDGCHRFLLLGTKRMIRRAKKDGWDKECIYKIDDLPEFWETSCRYRYVYDYDGFIPVIPQWSDVKEITIGG